MYDKVSFLVKKQADGTPFFDCLDALLFGLKEHEEKPDWTPQKYKGFEDGSVVKICRPLERFVESDDRPEFLGLEATIKPPKSAQDPVTDYNFFSK